MLQVTNLVSSISDTLDDQSSPVRDNDDQASPVRDYDDQASPIRDYDDQASPVRDYDDQASPLPDYDDPVRDYNHQPDDMITTLDDQQTSAEELEDLEGLDGLDGLDSSSLDHILGALPRSSSMRPRSLTLSSPYSVLDAEPTRTFMPGHGRSQSVTAAPATYLPSSTSDFPSPPTTPPNEDVDSNERYDRILNLLTGLIGEGQEALESEGTNIIHRKTSHANMHRHTRGNSVSEAATATRPQSRVSNRSSGRSSRLSMRSDGGSRSALGGGGGGGGSGSSSSGTSDEGESNNTSLRRASVELDAESDLSDFSDEAAMSPGHSRSSSMSDAEANDKVEAFRRSLHELDRVDVVADYDMGGSYDDEADEEEGVEEGVEDAMTRPPAGRLSQLSSPVQTHPRSVFQSPEDAIPSLDVETADEWDDDDPPLSAFMNLPTRNNGRMPTDLTAENPLLQSIKRVDTNLRCIEQLSFELFDDEEDEPYGEEDLDNEGETAEAIAVRDKFLSSMRWSLRRNFVRFLFEGLFFVFAYLVCSPLLIGIAHERVVIAVGLIMAAINQLNHHSRFVWAKDSTELPGWYPVKAIYNGLAMLAPANSSSSTKYRSPAKTHLVSTPSGSPQHTLQRALPQSSLRNSVLPDADVQHHHHHFTCDQCQQKLEVVTDHAGLDQERESVARLARYEQMPGRRSRRMSV